MQKIYSQLVNLHKQVDRHEKYKVQCFSHTELLNRQAFQDLSFTSWKSQQNLPGFHYNWQDNSFKKDTKTWYLDLEPFESRLQNEWYLQASSKANGDICYNCRQQRLRSVLAFLITACGAICRLWRVLPFYLWSVLPSVSCQSTVQKWKWNVSVPPGAPLRF